MTELWKPKSNQILRDWLEAFDDEAIDKLTSWENDFLESITVRIESGYTLSEKQEEIFERIYAQKTK